MKALISRESECWDAEDVIEFFNSSRDKAEDVYPSEWLFLKEQLTENISILDIGCAQGGFSHIFSRHLKQFDYTGVDISLNMIQRAKLRFPQHRFLHCPEGSYSILNSESFDLVLALGILHLHKSWRDTVASAWKHTRNNLILDLRETHLLSVEDESISSFTMSKFGYKLPYNIINSSDALADLIRLCPGYRKIERYGYLHPVSGYAESPIQEVMATVYCIQR